MYDLSDVAYIYKAFLKKYEASKDHLEDLHEQIESDSELDCMTRMMEVAVEAAESIANLIDFGESDHSGAWAYDHLGDDITELPHALWEQSVLSSCRTDDVVRRYAIDAGFALKAD